MDTKEKAEHALDDFLKHVRLAERYWTSRPTVRRAIALLNAGGLLFP